MTSIARPGPQSLAKRQREQKKREKKLAKKAKMELRKELKESGIDPLANPEEGITRPFINASNND